MAGPFRDALATGGEGPEMVLVRAGRFRRGCLTGSDCRSEELPVREITFAKRFAVSKYEITFADWEACVAGGGCNGDGPNDEDWGRGERPVINVSWEDAEAYVFWLSGSTGAAYRLPSEAEWEYAARAGTETVYGWGNEIGQGRANCSEEHCRDGFPNTAPVGSFPANRWGLHDMHGNVQEWVQGLPRQRPILPPYSCGRQRLGVRELRPAYVPWRVLGEQPVVSARRESGKRCD